jgi:hypothetical protein
MAEEDYKQLPAICSRYDKGGGVGHGATFMVYTNMKLSQHWSDRSNWHSGLEEALLKASRPLKNHIRFHYSTGELDDSGVGEWTKNLHSLPSPPAHPPNLLDRRPWFAINAAKADSLDICGQKDAIQTLIMVLGRPWCVLELCCHRSSTVLNLLGHFAELLAKEDPKGYEFAVEMLQYEKACRLEEVPGPVKKAHMFDHLAMQRLRHFSAAIFPISEQSYDGFWLRLICCSAVRLGTSLSRFAKLLGAMNGNHCVTKDAYLGLDCNVFLIEFDEDTEVISETTGQISLVNMYASIIAELTAWVS